jgi:hypothetical protein
MTGLNADIKNYIDRTLMDSIKRVFDSIKERLDRLDKRLVALEDALAHTTSKGPAATLVAKDNQASHKSTSTESTALQLVDKKVLGEISMVIGKQLMVAVDKKLENVSKQIVAVSNRLDKDIIPEINKMGEWVTYNTQDEASLLNNYRMAVLGRATDDDERDTLQITDGKLPKGHLREGVELFWKD